MRIMSAREVAEAEVLRLLEEVEGMPGEPFVQLLTTLAFLRGWSHGLKDAQRVHREVYSTVLTNGTAIPRQAG